MSATLVDNRVTEVARYPVDALQARSTPWPRQSDSHLVVAADHPVPALRSAADIVFARCADPTWPRTALSGHPFAAMAAAVAEDWCVVALRDGPTLRLTHKDGAALDPLLAVSALYLWPTDCPPTTFHVETGRATATFTLGS
ncbi:hypothetical protein [Actinokineospora diospyrosa]|uniref:Uncharacterized protein n=1 Tax=Actinokineospora diospyrosa TaxID=103728 RepID=A0ABT1IBP1_9PSEU|nr:hypothetical protein [Actinokineospora diospyrosa]MCP2270055.1 hypothetical protein [Actinokineospora diospyrosa]